MNASLNPVLLAKPCAKCSNQTGYFPTKEDLTGLEHTQFITSNELVIECYWDYQPAERMTRDEPGCEEDFTLVYACLNGADMSEVFAQDMVELAKEEAFEDANKRRQQDDEDRGEALYLARQEEQAY